MSARSSIPLTNQINKTADKPATFRKTACTSSWHEFNVTSYIRFDDTDIQRLCNSSTIDLSLDRLQNDRVNGRVVQVIRNVFC